MRSTLLAFIDDSMTALNATPKETPSPTVSPTSSETLPTTAKITGKTFADVQPIFVASCSGCHDGDYQFALKTADDLTPTVKKRVLKALKAGSMPEGDDTKSFKDSLDGKALIDWLSQENENLY